MGVHCSSFGESYTGDDAVVRVRRRAMGCEFELVLCGRDRDYLVDAGNEAFEEVERLEEQLSVFIPTSEISYINAAAASEPVRVEPRLFDLLLAAARLSEETEGAFDITAGAMVELWDSSADGAPSKEQTTAVLVATGMSKVLLDRSKSTIRFADPDVKLNLGALGKGYAVAQIVELLVERGIDSALVSAGTSTVYALGSPPDDDAWSVGIRSPVERDKRVGSIRLRDRALSTSGIHERFIEIDGEKYGHIMDPRNGQPADGLLAAAAIASDPAESDALSTAFFIMGIDAARMYCERHAGVGAVLIAEGQSDSNAEIIRIGV